MLDSLIHDCVSFFYLFWSASCAFFCDFAFNSGLFLHARLHKEYYYIRYASRSENLCESSILLNDDIYNTEFTRTDSLAIRASQSIDNVTDLFGKNNLQRSVYSLNGVNGTLDDMK